MNFKSFALVVIVMLFISSFGTKAQDASPTIKYGETINGILPSASDEVEYAFTGKASDIVIVEVMNDDILNGLFPELQLLNERGTKLAETSDIQDGLENFDNLKSKITIEIPADGDYTILVTDGTFQSAQNNAKFVLRLLQPEILKEGTEIADSVSNKVNNYYVVLSKDPFAINYNKQDGDFFPAINIDRVDNGKLERMASLYGNNLDSGMLSVTPNRNSLHLITVTKGLYDMDLFSDTDTDYTLEFVKE